MRGISYLLLLVCFVLASCSENKRVPNNVLPAQKFEAVFKDIVIADALNTERSFKDTGIKIPIENTRYFQKVFAMHAVTKNQFMVSYNYYLTRPDLLKGITDSVSAQLTRKSEALSVDTSKPKPNGYNSTKTGTGTGNK